MDFEQPRHDHMHGLRKSNKPLLEKKRRARINKSLDQLKSLVLDALKKDTARYSKLEKADILEMTVKHLRELQRQQMAVAVQMDPSVLSKFRAGFSECLQEVDRYLGTVDGAGTEVRMRLLQHLANCSNNIDHVISAPQPTYQHHLPHSAPMTFPVATQLGALPGYPPHVSSGYPCCHTDMHNLQSSMTGTWSPTSTDSSPESKYSFGGIFPSGLKSTRMDSPGGSSSISIDPELGDSDDVTSDEDEGKENVHLGSARYQVLAQRHRVLQNEHASASQSKLVLPGIVQHVSTQQDVNHRVAQANFGAVLQVKEEPVWRPW